MSPKKTPLTRVVGRRKTAASNAQPDNSVEPKSEGGLGRPRACRGSFAVTSKIGHPP